MDEALKKVLIEIFRTKPIMVTVRKSQYGIEDDVTVYAYEQSVRITFRYYGFEAPKLGVYMDLEVSSAHRTCLCSGLMQTADMAAWRAGGGGVRTNVADLWEICNVVSKRVRAQERVQIARHPSAAPMVADVRTAFGLDNEDKGR